MTLLCGQCMNGLHQGSVASKRVEGGRLIGLPQVAHIDLWGLQSRERRPGPLVLSLAPDPRTRVPFRPLGRPRPRADVRGPPPPLGGRRAALVPEPAGQAGRKGRRQGLHEALEGGGRERGPCQTAACPRGRGPRALARDRRKDGRAGTARWHAPGGEAPPAPGQHANTTVVLTAPPERAAVLGRDALLPRLATARLKRPEGVRGVLGDGAAGPCAWP
jgi:hypothetical protein